MTTKTRTTKTKPVNLTPGDRVQDDTDTTGTIKWITGRIVGVRWDYGQTESVDTKMVDLTKIN